MASGCRIGTCGVCLDDGVRGVACGAQARHIICATCAPMEVQRVLQDLLEPTALERFRQRGGLIKCVQDGCIATYSDEFLAPLLPASTEQHYRREQADVARYHRAWGRVPFECVCGFTAGTSSAWEKHLALRNTPYSSVKHSRVIRAAGDSEEAATAQYLRDHYRNAVQCPRCGAGPVIPEQCADLQAHHGETLSRGGRISNACPSCGFFSRNRGDWASWDGLLRRSQDEIGEGLSRERQQMLRVLMNVCCIEDAGFAHRLLQDNDWQLDASVNSYLDRSPPRGAQEQPRRRVVARVGDHEVVNAGLNAVPDGVHATLPSWAWSVLLLFLVAAAVFWLMFVQPGARPCPKGKFDSGLEKGCVECPPGHFKHSDGANMCKPCPVNTYAAGPGSTACEGCLRGEVSLLGQKSCQLCPAGTFASKGACKPCLEGLVSDRGSAQCAQPGARPCPKGKFDSGLAKGCVECPPGHFKHSDGAGMCKPCPVNTYAAGPGSTACEGCLRGEVSLLGQKSCQLCPAGTFASKGACEPCLEGLVSDRGSAQCAQPGARPCPKGKFDSGLAKGCVECPPGLFKHSDGAGMCMPEGSYTASCDQCALMGFAPNQQLRCTCKNGKGHDVESALRLSTCKNGEWVGNVNGILSCKPVPLGFEGGLVKSIGLAAGAAVTSTVGYGLYWLLTQGD